MKYIIDPLNRVLTSVLSFLSGAFTIITIISVSDRNNIIGFLAGMSAVTMFGLSYLAYKFTIRKMGD